MEREEIRILNVGFPKVGNTWIGRVLSNALNARFMEYDESGTLHVDSTMEDVLQRISGAIPGRKKTAVRQIEKTHLLPSGRLAWRNRYQGTETKVVYLRRDPRDMAVSFFYFTYHNRPYVETGHIRKCGWFERKLFLFRVMVRYHIHRAQWAPFVHASITYEEMWADAHTALVTLLEKLGIEFDDVYLREAISYFSWGNTAKGRQPGDAVNTSFLRSGVTGSHEKEFDYIDKALSPLALWLAWAYVHLRFFPRRARLSGLKTP